MDKVLQELLQSDVQAWNEWKAGASEWPDLTDADLEGADLREADLRYVNLERANLRKSNLSGIRLTLSRLSGADLAGAYLPGAELTGAKLQNASLIGAHLRNVYLDSADLREANLAHALLSQVNFVGANLAGATLVKADMDGADLVGANLVDADLSGARLVGARLDGADCTNAKFIDVLLNEASLVRTILKGANLEGCSVYGISAWDVVLDEATQQNRLVVTPKFQTPVIVDDLEVAQFIYLILNREKLRNVIDTVTRKGVLILGRFGDGGLPLLHAIAAWLRRPENGGYLPLLFDFPRPEAKTYTETIRTLAGLSRFAIVDLSGPSVPQEITATVDLHEIPFIPVIQSERRDWSMFRDFLIKDRVFEPIRFSDQEHLLQLLSGHGIQPAERYVETRQRQLDRLFGRV